MEPKIKIISDGTSTGTKLFVDGKEVINLDVIKFEAVTKKTLIKLNLTYVFPDAVDKVLTKEVVNEEIKGL